MLGVSQPTLSSWESGRKSPTIDSILKMAALYKVSTDYLLGNNVEKIIFKKVMKRFRIKICVLCTDNRFGLLNIAG